MSLIDPLGLHLSNFEIQRPKSQIYVSGYLLENRMEKILTGHIEFGKKKRE